MAKASVRLLPPQEEKGPTHQSPAVRLGDGWAGGQPPVLAAALSQSAVVLGGCRTAGWGPGSAVEGGRAARAESPGPREA